MSAVTSAVAVPRRLGLRAHALGPLSTLARRRFQLTARTPRELVVPLLTPVMFALVIAPALRTALHTPASYESFVAIETAGLLIPLNTMFAGIDVLVDRHEGAQRELLAAPIPRALLVLGNLLVALAVTGLQLAILIGVALARGIHFDASTAGVGWFLAAAALFTIGMYGVAEILASRVPKQEEYIARVPAIAILPWFLAGSLFPITALPSALEWVARFLPLTHGLALMLLRPARGRHRLAPHLAAEQHDRERRPEPGRDHGVRRSADLRVDPRLHARRYSLRAAQPRRLAGGTRRRGRRCYALLPS